MKKTTEDFIREAKKIHGDKYDYSKSTYTTARVKIAIICKDHGVFYKTVSHHISAKQGCPKCSSVCKDSTKEKMRDTWKNKINNGYKPYEITQKDHFKAMKALKEMPPEKREERNRKAGEKMYGRPQPMDGLTGKHAENINGKEWHFVNKERGFILKGKNLNQLIRDNQHMFETRHLVGDRCGTLAARCLRQLSVKPTKKTRTKGSWHGWTLG